LVITTEYRNQFRYTGYILLACPSSSFTEKTLNGIGDAIDKTPNQLIPIKNLRKKSANFGQAAFEDFDLGSKSR